jgi:hypothetical protein
MRRQCGYPFLFKTWASYEWSAPYHQWLLHEMATMLRSRQHLSGPETMRLAHILTELFHKWVTGGKPATKRWARRILRDEHNQKNITLVNLLGRLEFQDGSRRENSDDYPRLAVRLHGLLCMRHC